MGRDADITSDLLSEAQESGDDWIAEVIELKLRDEIMSQSDTEALVESEVRRLRPQIPLAINIASMSSLDSDFYKTRNWDQFNFRGRVMRGWEVNYYFTSMAMAHQGYTNEGYRQMIRSWNRFQDIPGIPGSGTMTSEMWFAAQAGYNDEMQRLRLERRDRGPRVIDTPGMDRRRQLDHQSLNQYVGSIESALPRDDWNVSVLEQHINELREIISDLEAHPPRIRINNPSGFAQYTRRVLARAEQRLIQLNRSNTSTD